MAAHDHDARDHGPVLRNRLHPVHAPGGPRLTSEERDERPACGPGCACTVGNEFGDRAAKHDLEAYRKRGPERTTRWLLEGLRGEPDAPTDGLTVLDIGAGVGAVYLELLKSGATHATDVDGSPAYVDAARGEAARQGLGDRVTYLRGDFVELAHDVGSADLVALDRVVCCYPDMQALVRLSVERARRRYGLVYPRDTWWIRAAGGSANAVARLFRRRIRIHIHRTADVEAIIAAGGLRPTFRRAGIFWQVAVFERG